MMKEITSREHPLVKHWMRLKSEASYRKQESRVLLEGKNCIQDVCKTIPAKRLIFSDKNLALPNAEEQILVSEEILKKISGTMHPEGIIAELEMPQNRDLKGVKKIVVCDRIQDPGNLGALIRSSLAFGWDGLFLLPGTCDPFNDKALRAAKGATFFLPLFFGGWEELQKTTAENGLELVVADTSGDDPAHFLQKPIALVLANESQGPEIPPNTAHKRVSLRMTGPMESLNVAIAGSILLHLYQDAP